MSHVFRVCEKKERERKSEGKDTELFPPFFSLCFSLSLSCPRNEQVSRETRHNKKRHDATLCLQHKARVLPARKLSRRNPPRRRDGASSSTQSGFRRANPGVSRLCTFLRFKLVSLSLSDGMMMVRISSRPEKSARARASFFPAFRRRRVRERSRRVGGGSSIQSSVFFFVVVSLTLFGRIVLSLFHISLPQKQIGF